MINTRAPDGAKNGLFTIFFPLEKVATEGYRSMSANGDYELDYQSYKLLFSNFLLGRTIYGPGKYIFGCFDNRDMNEPYKIVYDM